MKPKLAISGAAGRMGRRIVALAIDSENFEIISAKDRTDHPDFGRDAGLLANLLELGVKVEDKYKPGADVVIDFSLPEAVQETIDYCIDQKAALVMGTTGLSDDQLQNLESASKRIPVIYGTNMSVGMNVLFSLVGKVANLLGEDYDIEIVEEHHRFKKDSPSGSALTLAENICSETGRPYPGSLVHGREGKDAVRKQGQIGMHAVRCGDITGVHSVMYSTLGETITINHRASNRDNFVRGAIRAAAWLAGKKPGWYSMMDVLGLNK